MRREAFRHLFGDSAFAVIGMVHLLPLPGSPRYGGSMEAVVQAGLQDAGALAAGGVHALMVENLGDAPYYPDRVPAETIAAMTAVVSRLRQAIDLPMGVNVLRNDGCAAMAVAAATGCAFIRVNVLASAMVTDQGVIQGMAHKLLRLRQRLQAQVRILADVHVKHARPLADGDIVQDARDLCERALADALIVSGTATGAATPRDRVQQLRQALPEVPILVGSGLTPETAGDFVGTADGAIVGTFFKAHGRVENRVDPERVKRMMKAINEQVR